MLLDSRHNVLCAKRVLAVPGRHLHDSFARLKTVDERLRCYNVLIPSISQSNLRLRSQVYPVRRESARFDDDLIAVCRGPVKGYHERVRIARARVHHGHLVLLCANKPRHGGNERLPGVIPSLFVHLRKCSRIKTTRSRMSRERARRQCRATVACRGSGRGRPNAPT